MLAATTADIVESFLLVFLTGEVCDTRQGTRATDRVSDQEVVHSTQLHRTFGCIIRKQQTNHDKARIHHGGVSHDSADGLLCETAESANRHR